MSNGTVNFIELNHLALLTARRFLPDHTLSRRTKLFRYNLSKKNLYKIWKWIT